MNNHNLLDYTEAYPEPFDPSDLPTPIRWLTGLYLFMWGINFLGIWITEFNEWMYTYNVFNILYLAMAGMVFWAMSSDQRSEDGWIKRYRAAVGAGIGLIFLYRILSPLMGYGGMASVLSSVGYYLAFTGAGVWLIRRWRLREQAGRWWMLWERWSWYWAIGNLINYVTYVLKYPFGWDESNGLFWTLIDWVVYVGVFLLALYALVQRLSSYTDKEQRVGGLSWLAFGALLLIGYGNTIDLPYVYETVAALGLGLTLWTGYIVLKAPDRVHAQSSEDPIEEL